MGKRICDDRRGADKVKHHVAAVAIMAVAGVILAHLSVSVPWLTEWTATWIASGLTVAALVGKEVYDRFKKGGHFCVWDIWYGLLGVLWMAPVVWLSVHFISRFI